MSFANDLTKAGILFFFQIHHLGMIQPNHGIPILCRHVMVIANHCHPVIVTVNHCRHVTLNET